MKRDIIIIIQFIPLFLGLPKKDTDFNLKPLYQAPQTINAQQNSLKKKLTVKPATTNLEILKFKGEECKNNNSRGFKEQKQQQSL